MITIISRNKGFRLNFLNIIDENARNLKWSKHKIYVYGAEFEVERILTLCRKLVGQHEKEYQKNDGDKNGLTEANEVVGLASMTDFHMYASKKKIKHVRSELEQYLEEDILPQTSDFDLLTWWMSNKSKYSILSRIAMDILAILVFTVASESALHKW
ncbi:hypothetical protein ACS0TY_017213 [Phlomoides rotata]